MDMQTKGADLQLPSSVRNQNVHNKKGKARAPFATIKKQRAISSVFSFLLFGCVWGGVRWGGDIREISAGERRKRMFDE